MTTPRYFEDYPKGAQYDLGTIAVEEDEVLGFARRFDPQPIHVDSTFAAQGPHGGVIASGWHTAALMMRLYATRFLSPASSVASPGIESLRGTPPVRPGDQLTVLVTIEEAVGSRSKPERGILTTQIEVRNQDDVAVLSMRAVNIILRRPAGDAA